MTIDGSTTLPLFAVFAALLAIGKFMLEAGKLIKAKDDFEKRVAQLDAIEVRVNAVEARAAYAVNGYDKLRSVMPPMLARVAVVESQLDIPPRPKLPSGIEFDGDK